MKKEIIKNIIILILIIIVIFFVAMYLLKLNQNIKAKQLIKDSLSVQSIVSEYIGKMKSDTFDIYTTEQLLIGSTDIKNIVDTKIKNNQDADLLALVDVEGKISKENSISYKINIENFEKKFDIKLYNEDEISWYIQSTGAIKINYIIKPNWWTNELDAIYLGN